MYKSIKNLALKRLSTVYIVQFSDSKVFFGYNLPFDSARVIKLGDVTAIYICLSVLKIDDLCT